MIPNSRMGTGSGKETGPVNMMIEERNGNE